MTILDWKQCKVLRKIQFNILMIVGWPQFRNGLTFNNWWPSVKGFEEVSRFPTFKWKVDWWGKPFANLLCDRKNTTLPLHKTFTNNENFYVSMKISPQKSLHIFRKVNFLWLAVFFFTNALIGELFTSEKSIKYEVEILHYHEIRPWPFAKQYSSEFQLNIN